jgi:hypothetical protein
LSGVNIGGRQPWMIGDDGLRARTCSQLAQHKLDRDPRSPDDWLPAHDLGIDLDPFVRHDDASCGRWLILS